MKRLSLAMALTLVLALVIVGVASAITNGQPDGDAHPYVGLLIFDDAPGHPAWRCSGSLIAPNLVLTAGHCTDGAVAARIWMQKDVTYDAVPFPLYPYGGPGSGAVEGTPDTYPGFCMGCASNSSITNFGVGDVGVVVLDESINMDVYAKLPTAGMVDKLKNKAPIDFVGYGVSEQIMTYPGENPYDRWTGPRIRMYAPSNFVSGKFSWSSTYLRLALNPGGGTGGTCFGDSGGPDLKGGTNIVLGVNSYVTNINCSGNGYSYRIDQPVILKWINGFLP